MQRIHQMKMDSMLRSVGRNGHRTWWERLLKITPKTSRRDLDSSFDTREREDVWKALRF